MSLDENKAVVRDYLERMARNDESMADLLAEDIVWWVPPSTDYGGTYHGKQALLDKVLIPMAEQRNENGFSEEILRIIGEGDVVVTESKGQKTTVQGHQYNNEYAFIYELSGGKICRWRCYLDTMLLESTHNS